MRNWVWLVAVAVVAFLVTLVMMLTPQPQHHEPAYTGVDPVSIAATAP